VPVRSDDGLKSLGRLTYNPVLQLTDPVCHGPGYTGGDNGAASGRTVGVGAGDIGDTPGPRQPGPQLKTTLGGLKIEMTDKLQDDEIAELERMLHTGDGKHNWKAASQLADYFHSDPQVVWRLVAKWGCSKNEDTRMAIACCVLEEMLCNRFEDTFPLVKQLAIENREFAHTFCNCWGVESMESKDPVNAKRWRALQRRFEGRPVIRRRS